MERFGIRDSLVKFLRVRLCTDALSLQRFFKLRNSFVNLCMGVLELLDGDCVELLRLLVVELKLLHLALLLPLLVLLPVFNALLLPLFHEARIALKLVNLNASKILFFLSGGLFFGF